MKKWFNKGDRVMWSYQHSLNSKSKTTITKYGTVIEMTGGVKNVRYVCGSYVVIQFDGNKHPSKKPISEVFLCKQEKEDK